MTLKIGVMAEENSALHHINLHHNIIDFSVFLIKNAKAMLDQHKRHLSQA